MFKVTKDRVAAVHRQRRRRGRARRRDAVRRGAPRRSHPSSRLPRARSRWCAAIRPPRWSTLSISASRPRSSRTKVWKYRSTHRRFRCTWRRSTPRMHSHGRSGQLILQRETVGEAVRGVQSSQPHTDSGRRSRDRGMAPLLRLRRGRPGSICEADRGYADDIVLVREGPNTAADRHGTPGQAVPPASDGGI